MSTNKPKNPDSGAKSGGFLRVITGAGTPAPESAESPGLATQTTRPTSNATASLPSLAEFERLVHDLAALETAANSKQGDGIVSLTKARVSTLEDLAARGRAKFVAASTTDTEGDDAAESHAGRDAEASNVSVLKAPRPSRRDE